MYSRAAFSGYSNNARLIPAIQQCAQNKSGQDFMGLRKFTSENDSSKVPVDLKKLESMQDIVVCL